MKVLFLDIDGVLVTRNAWAKFGPIRDMFGHIFDPDAVAQLKRVIDETRARIVVSSSWKCVPGSNGLAEMRMLWASRSLPGDVFSVTPNVSSDERGEEIDMWLRTNEEPIEQFAIVDDDVMGITNFQMSHFVKTNFKDGLTKEKADELIALLNNKKDIE
jgi:hypothetical protein